MTREAPSAETPPPETPPRPKRWAMVGCGAAIVLVGILVVAAARYLRSPAALDTGAGRGGSTPGGWWSATGAEATGPQAGGTPLPDAKETANDLRRIMAGLVMAAASEDGPYEDPKNQDAEARQQFLADRFGLPFDTNYPRSAAPADIAPNGAQVLMVFESPERAGARMVLVRLRKDIHGAMADFQKQYVNNGWKVAAPPDPRQQTDQGWLMQFTRPGQVRFVYAQPRRTGEETLVAIYDSRY